VWRWLGGDVVSSTRNDTLFATVLFRVRKTPTLWTGRAKPSRAEPGRAEPTRTEPSREPSWGPGRAGPNRAEPARDEPNVPMAIKI
jgi:hypothetical protein